MEKIKVPEIRLEGFEGEWKRCDLEHIAIVNPKENLPDVFEYVDLESVVATKMIFHRTENKNTAPSRAQRLAKKGDIFFQTVRPYQKNNFLFEGADNPFVFSTGYAQIRTEVNGKFLLNVLQSATFVNDVIANCKGTGYPAINPNDLAVLPFYIPVDEIEQKAIGEYFDNLDTLITNAEDRHIKLLALKKSLLQKMFPQEGENVPRIRFEGFEGEWEKKKIGDLYECNNERNVNTNIGFDRTISIATMNYKEEGNGASSDSLANYKILRLGDIAFEGHTNKEFLYGRFVLNDIGDGIMSPRFSALRPRDLLPIHFWKYYIHHEPVMRRILVNSTKAGTMMNELDIDNFLEQVIYVPNCDEQKAIGDYFTNLDTLIEAQEQKITKLQQMKSALLQKMFV